MAKLDVEAPESAFGMLVRADPVGSGAVLSEVPLRPAVLEFLPDGCGWNDGGCAILADALTSLAGRWDGW